MGFHNIKAWEEGEVRESKGTAVFCSLHHHTTFSYLDGFGTPEEHNDAAARLDMFALGLTDHGNVTGHVRHEQAARKYGVKPIFGCEVYCGDIGEDATQKKNHLTVLAETPAGYQNLLEMVSRAYAEGYYYQPTVNGRIFREHAKGLIVLSGCQGSLLATSLVGGKNISPEDASYSRGEELARRFQDLLGDAYYLEVQAFPELEATRGINVAVGRISERLGIPLVATVDAHYTQLSEGHMQAILHSVRSGAKQSVEEMEQRWSYVGGKQIPLCPLSDKDIWRRLVHSGLSKKQAEQAVRNTRVIAERCTVTLPKATNLLYPLPPGVPDARALFRMWVNEGWHYRGFAALRGAERQRYIDRVKYEMGAIEEMAAATEMGIHDYFLVIADAVKFAKDSGIPVGPARGSAAASLVCYLLRITEVNSLLFPNLLFERFIDKNRHDLPDIDLDFDDELRWKVRAYLVDKYGEDKVGNIATFTQYKGKNSLIDVQRSAYPDDWDCKRGVELVNSLLIERRPGDLRANATIEDTVEMFPQVQEIFKRWPELWRATELEGNVRGMSLHAAGLVIANEPLARFCAQYTRYDDKGRVKTDDEGNPLSAISLDKYDAEYLGALKIDALGLKTMAMIRLILEQVGMSLMELYALPFDDDKTLQGFRDGDVIGVFQFDGRAMSQVNQGVQPDSFFEVCDINALARPGPLHSGATSHYIDVKHGRAQAVSYHPIIDRITAHTQGQIVYQEQILQVCRDIGGFSWEEAARIRKIISKKRGEQEFNTMRAKFIEGAAVHGLSDSDADKVFSLLATAGAYAFNAAHCLTGDTVVTKGGGYTDRHITIQELYDRPKWRQRIGILAQDEDGRIRPVKIRGIYYQGVQETFRVSLANGRSVEATADHLILTEQGWVRVDELNGHWVIGNAGRERLGYKGHNRLADGPYSGFSKGKNGQYALWHSWRDQAGDACEACGQWHDRLETSHKDANRKNNEWSNLQLLCPSCHRNYDMEHNGSRYGGWHHGLLADSSPVVSVVSTGLNPVYDIEVDSVLHNFVANDIVVHNCVSYGMLAYWTMWLKQHHPAPFFVAALTKYKDKKNRLLKRFESKINYIMRDALKHGIDIEPIDLDCGKEWAAFQDENGWFIRPGWVQVPGIGEKTADAILASREADGPFEDWDELQRVKGVGPKTVDNLLDFRDNPDPFELHELQNRISPVRDLLLSKDGVWAEDTEGLYGNRDGEAYQLPRPTHTSLDVPYEKGADTPVCWVGVGRDFNLKDIFELHHSRTGEKLDPATVRDPHLFEYMVMTGEDESGVCVLTVDRWSWPKWKDTIWSIDLDKDVLLVRGIKKGFQARRAIYISHIWVIEPD